MTVKRYARWLCLVGGLLFLAVAAQIRSTSHNIARAEDQYAKTKKVDPIEANGAIFVDWPKPDVALVFSGDQLGYLEPCGCAGLENQKGGLMRRFTLLKELRDKGWPIVAMDVGEQEKRIGVQAQMKLDFALRALNKLGYAAVGFGPADLKLDLLSILVNFEEGASPFVSANVGIVDFDSGFTQRYKVGEAGGMKIGVTSVLGKKDAMALANVDDVIALDPEAALKQVVPKLKAAGCNQLVLLSYADPAETKALAAKFPEFNWVATGRGAEVPPNEAVKIEGSNGRLIEVGQKGMYVTVIGLYKNGSPAYRYQRVPLDHRFTDAPEIQQMHVDYQHQLQQIVEQAGWSGLGLKPSPHPTGRMFAGSASCAECHSNAAATHEQTPHIHATETLAKLDPPRLFDPECLSCHATGWEPQKYFPFESGFLGLKETPELVGNGCENCHGPAARHVAAERGEIEVTDEEMEELQDALRLTIVPNEGNKDGQEYAKGTVVKMCMQCHDHDNSPEFDFQKYWPEVEHKGMD